MGRGGLLLLAALGVIAVNVIVAAAFLPRPSPSPDASPAERNYFLRCVTCHGTTGEGSWRATIFLIRPGNLAVPHRMATVSDQYLFDIIKHGGASLGRPGMPSFAFHLPDSEIEELVAYVRSLSSEAP
ncbi:MAG: c-type cytochrome [Candidatus Methylomirabilia bacterium]